MKNMSSYYSILGPNKAEIVLGLGDDILGINAAF